jgi:hypothetical protein
MAAVDEAAWLELLAVQRRAGFNLPPDPIARPGTFLAAAINAEWVRLVAAYNLAGR